MKSILLVKKLLGLVEVTFGLVNASFSLPEWQAVKIIFFAPLHCFLSRTCPQSVRFESLYTDNNVLEFCVSYFP